MAHYRFFLYGGIAGIGKTTQILQLAELAKGADLRGAVYLRAYPAEGIGALGARLAARLQPGHPVAQGAHADPYARLLDTLARHHQILVVDDLHHVRRDELSTLIRLCRRAQEQNAPFRIVAAMRGDPQLSAMDLAAVHFERLGALDAAAVQQLAASWHLDEAAAEVAVQDARRGGAMGQPLTANVLMAMTSPAFVDKGMLRPHTSRSVQACRTLVAGPLRRGPAGGGMPAVAGRATAVAGKQAAAASKQGAVASKQGAAASKQTPLHAQVLELLATLVQIEYPMAREAAETAFGPCLVQALSLGLLDVVAGDVCVHALLHEVFVAEGPAPRALSTQQAAQLAAHLGERAQQQGEPRAYLAGAGILWRAEARHEAVEMLAQAIAWTHDAGFMAAFLHVIKELSTKAPSPLTARLRFLVAEARHHHTHASVGLEEMRALAADDDVWTRSRALAALARMYTELKEPHETIAQFAALEALAPPAPVLVQAGMLAAEALVALARQQEAEALIRRLLTLTQNSGAEADFARAEATLRRHLAEIMVQSGRLDEALAEATRAAEHFSQVQDAYQAAQAFGFVGDLQRELGDLVQARAAHALFLQAAQAAGDRDLAHVAQLADAWVALDTGDVAHAAKRVLAVKRELGAAPSLRLRRYLAATEGLLAAGRGQHERAAALLARVVEAWEAAGQSTIAGSLNTQMIRSLIACDRLDAAEAAVRSATAELDGRTNMPYLAALRREQALIRLRRGEVDLALAELVDARKLFAQAKNRREEAMTLHRISYAALDEGYIELAQSTAEQALRVATDIKHDRAQALARELMARTALLADDATAALAHAKEAHQSLRRLGDEVGVLHVSEALVQALLGTGDLAGAIKLGARVSTHAHQAGMRELRVRLIVLTGIGLWRRGKLKGAARCFRPLPKRGYAVATRVLMWRFGESLALSQKQLRAAHLRRTQWAEALAQIPHPRRGAAIASLEQLGLTPRDRCILQAPDGTSTPLNTQTLALVDTSAAPIFLDAAYLRILVRGKAVALSAAVTKLLLRLALHPESTLGWEEVQAALGLPADAGASAARRSLKAAMQALTPHAKAIELVVTATGVELKLHQACAKVLPIWLCIPGITPEQAAVLKLLRRHGTASMLAIQDQCNLGRAVARREVGALLRDERIALVREGRGQAYRLA